MDLVGRGIRREGTGGLVGRACLLDDVFLGGPLLVDTAGLEVALKPGGGHDRTGVTTSGILVVGSTYVPFTNSRSGTGVRSSNSGRLACSGPRSSGAEMGT